MERAQVDTTNPIEAAWFNFLKNNLCNEITITFAEELTGNDAPRPQGRYITLNITTGPDQIGQDELRLNSDTKYFEVTGIRQYNLNIQSFRYNSRDVLDRIVTMLGDPLRLAELKNSQADIAINDIDSVNNVSDLLDAGYEKRHSLDITFSSSVILATEIRPIERAKATGVIDGAKEGQQTRVTDVDNPT